MPRRILFAFLMGLCLFGFLGWPKTSPAAEQVAPPDIGRPTSLAVEPANVALSLGAVPGVQQLVVTGKYADGSVRDLTWLARGRIEGGHVALGSGLFLEAVQPGRGSVEIEADGLKVSVPVSVNGGGKPRSVSFRNELMAVLNVGGCNQGACHGTPSGKNGFKLSLRGFDPAADYLSLTHDVLGRRSGRQDPQGSLVYLKALGRVPHDGGIRFAADSLPGRTLHAWLMHGARSDLDTAATLKKLEVLPGGRVLREPGRRQQLAQQFAQKFAQKFAQQLAVLAHFSDGQVRDVTRLSVFSSSDTAIASVDAQGLVQFHRAGEIAILCRYLQEMVPVRLMFLQPRPGFQWPGPKENNYIDRHVFAKLRLLDIAPSELCTDQEFIRRAYLDVCGVLPRPDEVRDFLASNKEGKRAALIDRLLERPEYADLWALKWSDVLRSSRKTLQLRGVKAYHQWIRDQIAANTPFDQVVRALITAEGSTFSNPPANYYRAAREPTALAETTAQLFFGIRMQCAKCHNHPFERWSQDDYYGMTAFFAQVKRKADPREPGDPKKKDGAELIFVDAKMNVTHPRTGQPAEPRFLGDPQVKLAADKDRRLALAEWMTAPHNPFLARSVVNRIWFHLLGRGIVDPVDDFRDSNPSANDDLLDALARDFVEKKFDVKHILRTILNSRTYQLSAQANEFNKDDVKYFSHALTRVYSAEVLFDALCDLTEVPEKFPDVPPGTRAVQLFDGEFNHPFLKAFGQPGRALACECERESESNLTQVLQLISGPSVNERVRSPKNRIGKLLAAKKSDREILEELFLVALSRPPAAPEAQGLLDHVASSQDRRKGWEDVLWVLLNAKEFSFRH